MSGLPANVRELLLAAQTFLHGSTDPKAAIRRAARTSVWAHDPERLAAADAKRARKMAKRATPDQPTACVCGAAPELGPSQVCKCTADKSDAAK